MSKAQSPSKSAPIKHTAPLPAPIEQPVSEIHDLNLGHVEAYSSEAQAKTLVEQTNDTTSSLAVGADVNVTDESGQKRVFTARTWELLGTGDTRGGWSLDVKEPKEVKNMKAKKK